MARNIAAVALGFIVMVVIVLMTFAVAANVLTDEQAYRPGTFELSPLRSALTIMFTFIAAVAGGFAAASIARTQQALRAMAVFVFALMLIIAVPSLRYDRTQMPPRTGEPADRQTAMQIPPPPWIALLNPLLGAGGVIVGAMLRGRRVIDDDETGD